MFEPLVFFAAVAAATALKYETILIEGVKGFAPQRQETVGIPDGQCSGLIEALYDYPCYAGSFLAVLQVSVSNEDAIAKVIFSDDLGRVYIYRKGSCSGEALVEISWNCLPFYPPRPNKTGARTRDFTGALSQRICEGSGCQGVQSPASQNFLSQRGCDGSGCRKEPKPVPYAGLSQRTCNGAGCRKPRSLMPVPNIENKEKSDSIDETNDNLAQRSRRHSHDETHADLSERICDGSSCGKSFVPLYKSASNEETHDVISRRFCDGSGCKRVYSSAPNIRNKGRRHTHDYIHNGLLQKMCDGSNCGSRLSPHPHTSDSHEETFIVPSVRICDGSSCKRVQSGVPYNKEVRSSSDETHDVLLQRICDGSSCGKRLRRHGTHDDVSQRICDGSGCKNLFRSSHDDLSRRMCNGRGCKRFRNRVRTVENEGESRSNEETDDGLSRRICDGSGCQKLRQFGHGETHEGLTRRICDGSGCQGVSNRVQNKEKSESHEATNDVLSVRICDGSDCRRAQSPKTKNHEETKDAPSRRTCDGSSCRKHRDVIMPAANIENKELPE